jgi:hypothetical protein
MNSKSLVKMFLDAGDLKLAEYRFIVRIRRVAIVLGNTRVPILAKLTHKMKGQIKDKIIDYTTCL